MIFQSPYYKKDRNAIKSSTKNDKDYSQAENTSCEESLSKRRMLGDQIDVFEISKGFDNINAYNNFTVNRSNVTRRHNSWLVKDSREMMPNTTSWLWSLTWNYLLRNFVESVEVTTSLNRVDNFDSNPQLRYYQLNLIRICSMLPLPYCF